MFSLAHKVCNKQFIVFIEKYGFMYYHSPSARDNTDASHEISRHILR